MASTVFPQKRGKMQSAPSLSQQMVMTIFTTKSIIHCEHIGRRTMSKFEPSTYDMCGIGSFPLNLEWNEDALQIPASSLKYLRSQLPDSSEFEEYVTDLLAQSGCTLHFAFFC